VKRSVLQISGIYTKVPLCALLGLTLLSGGAQAGGLYLQEFATTSMGTAGAGRTAYASDGGTILHNPAPRRIGSTISHLR